MQSLVCTQPGILSYSKKTAPEEKAGHAIIQVKRIGVCGTDLHAFEGTQPYFSYPRILGHELSGTLIHMDGKGSILPGSLVTILPYFNCNQCIACRNGRSNCCRHLQVFGVHIDGGMQEYISVPAQAVVHHPKLNEEELALVEPLAIGAHGIGRANVTRDEWVLVMGAGPIGLAAMDFARLAGARVIALDTNKDRLLFCHSHGIAQYIIDARENNVVEQLETLTGGDMPAVVVDATGNLAAINIGFQYLSHGGRYVLIGLQKDAIHFSHPEFHKREATLLSSRNATRQDFEQVMLSIANGSISPLKYLTHRIPFKEAGGLFPQLLLPEMKVVKAVLTF